MRESCRASLCARRPRNTRHQACHLAMPHMTQLSCTAVLRTAIEDDKHDELTQ